MFFCLKKGIVFAYAFSAVPFSKGDETACCRAGDDYSFASATDYLLARIAYNKTSAQRETKFNNSVTSFPPLGGPRTILLFNPFSPFAWGNVKTAPYHEEKERLI